MGILGDVICFQKFPSNRKIVRLLYHAYGVNSCWDGRHANLIYLQFLLLQLNDHLGNQKKILTADKTT